MGFTDFVSGMGRSVLYLLVAAAIIVVVILYFVFYAGSSQTLSEPATAGDLPKNGKREGTQKYNHALIADIDVEDSEVSREHPSMNTDDHPGNDLDWVDEIYMPVGKKTRAKVADQLEGTFLQSKKKIDRDQAKFKSSIVAQRVALSSPIMDVPQKLWFDGFRPHIPNYRTEEWTNGAGGSGIGIKEIPDEMPDPNMTSAHSVVVSIAGSVPAQSAPAPVTTVTPVAVASRTA